MCACVCVFVSIKFGCSINLRSRAERYAFATMSELKTQIKKVQCELTFQNYVNDVVDARVSGSVFRKKYECGKDSNQN
jgi:hypothetical protein